MPISRSLTKSLSLLSSALSLPSNDDLILRPFHSMSLSCALLYIDGMSGGDQLARHILSPMMACSTPYAGDRAKAHAVNSLIAISECKLSSDIPEIVDAIMCGQSVVLIDTVDTAIILDTRAYAKRGIEKPSVESVVMGPHEGFNESLRDNLTLLHRLVHSPDLLVKMKSVGTRIPTQFAICYLNGVCPAETVAELERRIDGAAVDHVLSIGMLEQLIEDDPFAPLPQLVTTERPDRCVSFLAEGQIIILVDGNPFALAAPMSLWHLFHAPDDTGMRWQYGTFLRLLRLIGAFCALILPAAFLSLVLFSPNALPMTLITSIMESRTVVPVSLFTEAVLMLLMFDLINEASTRVPGLMGSSLGLVSALILGSAAVDASLVSPLLIIVVAISGLGGYAIPDYSLSFAFRLLQMLLLIASGLMGFAGLAALLTVTLCWVAGMESLGAPYLAPTNPSRDRNPDLLLRAPIFHQRLRAYLASPSRQRRARGAMRRWDERE